MWILSMDASRCYQIERNVLRWEKWIRKHHTIPDNKWYLFIKSNIEAIEKKIEIKSAFPVKHVSFQTFLLGNLKKRKKEEEQNEIVIHCHFVMLDVHGAQWHDRITISALIKVLKYFFFKWLPCSLFCYIVIHKTNDLHL